MKVHKAQPHTASETPATESTRHHLLPFGAELHPEGGVRFRFFAPAAREVRLAIRDREPIGMQADGHGWHEITVPDAAPGTRYRYILPDGCDVPDPASRFQPEDIAGPSEVIDPTSYRWNDVQWTGRPWAETVLYELHIGTFTAEGTLRAAAEKLDELQQLGVTALELMTLSDFAGLRNWGYDSVLLFAPDSAYGRPDDLKHFIDAAHARGMQVILDVVYNHFGPEGNFLPRYFPQILSKEHQTAWGAALNFDGECSREVREFIVENALYWIEEFHMDGLRLDATHAMLDNSDCHILDELASRVRHFAGARQVHLILENENNIAPRLMRTAEGAIECYTAQWNHDIDHLLGAGFMGDFADREIDDKGETDRLGKALSHGFVIAAQENAGKEKNAEQSAEQGSDDKGAVNGDGKGHAALEAGCHVPPNAFISFLQSHDLVGNRIFGERVTSLLPEPVVRALVSVVLLLPQTPMLFMGEEWGASAPFTFFCDFHGHLSEDVQKGRCEQISKLPGVSAEELKNAPNCQADSTFLMSKLNWAERTEPKHAGWLTLYRRLLEMRRERIVPLLEHLCERCGSHEVKGPGGLTVQWKLNAGKRLVLEANLWHQPRTFAEPRGELLWVEGQATGADLGPWTVRWTLH